jgi:hypothetical protein
MFFAETLGPMLTPQLAHDLTQFLRKKLAGRDTISPEQLREAVAEYLYVANVRASADAVIDFMARNGRLTFQGPTPTGAATFGRAA